MIHFKTLTYNFKYSCLLQLLLLLQIFFLVSCTSQPSKIPGNERSVEDEISSRHVVPVFYGTDRKGTGPTTDRSYSSERGDFEYGLSFVHIPKNHDPGHLERPYRFLFVNFDENKDEHVMIIKPPQKLSKNKFIKQLQETVEANSKDGLFVFIHGYNVSFEDAILRTGQLAFDLSFEGPAVTYSWPSKNSALEYLTDSEEIQLTTPYLKRFLMEIKEKSGAKRICVLAHSMGNRAFTQVLAELSRENQDGKVIFDQVILAAPDIDAEIFIKSIAPSIKGSANQISLYTSANDNVLEFSSTLRNSRPRAGEAGDNLVIVDGINTIDASKTNDGFSRFLNLGHSYYGEKLIVDLHYVIKNSLNPDKRLLKKVNSSMGDYWELMY